MSKSKARFLAELLGADGTVKEDKSALDISGGKISLEELPEITDAKISSASNWNSAHGWGDHAAEGYLTSETNDLTSNVTWANVPNVNITEGSVTQHQAALSITERQISDLQTYLTASSTPGGSLTGSFDNVVIQYGTSYAGTPAQGSFFFDSLNQKLKVYTGSDFIDAIPDPGAGGGGEATDANTTFRKYVYTLASETNAVTGSDDNSETLSYVTDGTENVEVFVNGVKVVQGTDYVSTTGSSVAFTYNIPAGSTVEIQVYELLTNDAYYTKSQVYTKTETNTQISTAVSGLVDSSPTTLDTLNELAAALGDDPNFAATTANSIGTKLPLTGGSLSGNLIVGSDANGSVLTINDIDGARYRAATGGYDLKFQKHVENTDSYVTGLELRGVSNNDAAPDVYINNDLSVGGALNANSATFEGSILLEGLSGHTLDITATSSAAVIYLETNNRKWGIFNSDSLDYLTIKDETANRDALRIADGGNHVHLGITTEGMPDWGSNGALSLYSTGNIGSIQVDAAGNLGLARNAYQNGSWYYNKTGVSSLLNLEGKQLKFFTAESGAAGTLASYDDILTVEGDSSNPRLAFNSALDTYASAKIKGSAGRQYVVNLEYPVSTNGSLYFDTLSLLNSNISNDNYTQIGFRNRGTDGEHHRATIKASRDVEHGAANAAGKLELCVRNGVDPFVALGITAKGHVQTPHQPSFRASRNTAVPVAFVAGSATILYDDVRHNTSSSYNSSDGRFTAPIAGDYYFSVIKQLNTKGADQVIRHPSMAIRVNGVSRVPTNTGVTSGPGLSAGTYQHFGLCFSAVIKLAKDDYVDVIFGYDNSPSTLYEYGTETFSGYLLG